MSQPPTHFDSTSAQSSVPAGATAALKAGAVVQAVPLSVTAAPVWCMEDPGSEDCTEGVLVEAVER